MLIMVKVDTVRAVRDAQDVKLAEGVCFKAVPDVPNQPAVATLNITCEDEQHWGEFKPGDIVKLELTKGE